MKNPFIAFLGALKACSARSEAENKVPPSLPLYKNLIALERACGKTESAIRSCQRLLKASAKETDLWLCLASLEQLSDRGANVTKVYKNALENCSGHAQVAYSAAKHFLKKVPLSLLPSFPPSFPPPPPPPPPHPFLPFHFLSSPIVKFLSSMLFYLPFILFPYLTLYFQFHFQFPILSYPILSYPISYPISHPIPSPILSYCTLFHHIFCLPFLAIPTGLPFGLHFRNAP